MMPNTLRRSFSMTSFRCSICSLLERRSSASSSESAWRCCSISASLDAISASRIAISASLAAISALWAAISTRCRMASAFNASTSSESRSGSDAQSMNAVCHEDARKTGTKPA
jgi:hypothetical protein